MCVYRGVSATTGVGPRAQGAQVPVVAATGDTRVCEGSDWWQLDKGPQVAEAHISRVPATVETGVDMYGVGAYASV